MKKIGILFGMERTFPQAFIDRVNSKNVEGITAEAVRIDKVAQAYAPGYDVIIDRISQDVPFYRTFLKNAAICGTAVLNNPFWWSADDKFFNNCLAIKVGVPVPKTVILPSNEHPTDTSSESFSNLVTPLDWESMLGYIGFPAYMKPYAGGGWKNVYKINDSAELFAKHAETGQLVMLLQEEIQFDAYFRCYCLGGKYVKIMHYEPRNPHHLRYVADHTISDELMQTIHNYVLRLNHALGYDFNTVEFAVRDALTSGDAGLIASACEKINDEDSDYLKELLDSKTIGTVRMALHPIRDLEAIQLLDAAIAKRDGKPAPKHVSPPFNHPIRSAGLQLGQQYRIKTSQGDIILALEPEVAPGSCAAFDSLVATGYYNGKFFHRLVQTITPAASGHQTPGELINYDNFTLLNHIVLIAVVQIVGAQGGI